MGRAMVAHTQDPPTRNNVPPMQDDCALSSPFLMLLCIILNDKEASHENNRIY
jgi:hypothetical protein